MRKQISLSSIILMLACLSACNGSNTPNATGPDATGILSGLVATHGTGITVEAQRDGVSRIVAADADGRYTFDDLVPGAYRLFASAPGYSRSTIDGTVEVVAGTSVTAGEIVLNWTGLGVPTATLTGVVLDADTGLPVADVFLNVACDPDQIICLGRSAFTDAQGRYTIPSIPPGFGFDLFIGKTGYPNHLEQGHLLGAEQQQVLNIQIER